VMVDPSRIPGLHHLPICGDDEDAKREAVALIGTFGWPPDAFLDLGDLTAARATEMYVVLWVRLYGATGTADVSIRVVRG
jgi:predicted dinucleotide-binding enzyme